MSPPRHMAEAFVGRKYEARIGVTELFDEEEDR
jgi:hypothetical protein